MTRYITVRGKKLNSTSILKDGGGIVPVFEDTFHPNGREGFWLLKKVGNWWVIAKYISSVNVYEGE
jgi:hypothetical protein